MHLGSAASWISARGSVLSFVPARVTIPSYYDFFGPKTAAVAIDYRIRMPISPGDRFEYHYRGKDKPLKEISFHVAGTDGFAVADLKKQTADSITFRVGTGDSNSHVLGVSYNNRLGAFLSQYVKTDQIPFSLQIWAVVVAFVLGALHALTPGHGKAIAAGYLVGERGTAFHALNLSLIMLMLVLTAICLRLMQPISLFRNWIVLVCKLSIVVN